MSDDEQPEVESGPGVEHIRVLRRRELEALNAGMSLVEARLFSESEISVSELRHLLAVKCPADLLARILL